MRLRTPRVALAIVAAAATLALVPATASAVPGPDGGFDALAAVGSDTTQDVTQALAGRWNSDTALNPSPRDFVYNVKAFSSTPTTVAGDADCGEITYATNPGPGQVQAPNGSSAGKAALRASAEAGDGCIDIARSSSGPSSSDPAAFEYYAFARDALTWSFFPGGFAPDDRNLSIDELRGIYNCTITRWSQVGGDDFLIYRYVPQEGSGSRSFFINSVLGFDPTTISSTGCPPVRTVQENDGAAIPSSDRNRAIFPFSAAQWIAQANGVATDRRGGAEIGYIDNEDPVIGPDSAGKFTPRLSVYRSATFEGARDVYHVLYNGSPGYDEAKRFAGFDSTGPGAVCKGNYNGTIRQYGFATLTDAGGNERFCRGASL